MSMRVWQWLGGGEGFGTQLGTLLMLAVGAGLVGVSATDARELARGKPLELSCAEWSRAPLEKARWVSVTGCRLDIASAATRRWKGWPSRSVDAGVPSKAHTVELFLPAAPIGAPVGTWSAVVVATKDHELLKLMDELTKLAPEQVDAFITTHEAELTAKLAPAHLEGYVHPIATWSSRAALNAINEQGAAVFVHGSGPPVGNTLLGLLVGMALLVWGFVPIARRVLLSREPFGRAE